MTHRRVEPLLHSRAAHLLEVAVDGVPRRHRKFGERIVHLLKFQIAALGNRHGPLDHRGRVLEELGHFVPALHKKLIAVELEAVALMNLRAGLHTQHHVVRMRVLAAQVVRVIRSHQRNAQLALQAKQVGAYLLLVFKTLVLNLQKEISLAEDVLILLRDGLGPQVSVRSVQIRVAQHFTQLSAQATRRADQSLAVFRQILFAYARLAIKAVQARLRRKPDQVPVALLVFRQHQQVVVLVVGRIGAMILRLAHVEFAAQNRLDAFSLRRLKEVHRSINIPVVRHGHGLLPQRRHAVHKLINVARAVEQGILSMQMQMGKFRHG